MKTMSKSDYLKLVGLLALADRHYDALLDIERAAAELVGIDGGPTDVDHLSDMMWGEIDHNDADTLLRRLEIAVEEDDS